MPAIAHLHTVDPKQELHDKVWPLVKDFEVLGPRLLLAVYMPPERTKGGIIMTDRHKTENRFQAVTALVMKMGPLAFVDDETHKWGERKPKVGDWVVYRVGDTYGIDVGEYTVRMIEDSLIFAIVPAPDLVA